MTRVMPESADLGTAGQVAARPSRSERAHVDKSFSLGRGSGDRER
jgi:hypothetical protein